MKLIFESENLQDYLQCTEIIDFSESGISALSYALRAEAASETELVRKTYEYVRDRVSHSADVSGTVVTCTASEVLRQREGICYAKAQLLAAMLRKNGIPCGFCYQLLRLDDDESPLILHGMNAVFIREKNAWIRLDARGNKAGVDAQFDLETERLAFTVRKEHGEIDYPYVFVNPDEDAVSALEISENVTELWENLPRGLFREL